MWVIAGRVLHFRKGTVEEHPVNHEKYFVQTDEFKLIPNFQHPQTPVWAPDWIKDDELYKLVKKENKPNAMMLQETNEGPPEDEESEEKPKAHTGLKLPAWKK